MAAKNDSIKLSKIRIDGGTQPRAKIDQAAVSDYADRIRAGDGFPPVVVFFDGVDHWLADGFHRFHATAETGAKSIACDVRKGTQREAVLFSCGANLHHGLRRTNADKRRAVQTLLDDAEWSKFSDRQIAEVCAVGHSMVSDQRAGQLSESDSSTRVGRDGKKRTSSNVKKTSGKKDEPDKTEETVETDREPGDDTDAIAADKAKRRASGKESVSSKSRAHARSAYGKLVRSIDAMGKPVAEAARGHLEAVLAVIEGKP